MTNPAVKQMVMWGLAVWLVSSLSTAAQQNSTQPPTPPRGLGHNIESRTQSATEADDGPEETQDPGEIEYAGLLWNIGPVAAAQVHRDVKPIRDRIHQLEQEIVRLQRELDQQRIAERQLIEPHFTAPQWREWGRAQRRQLSQATKLAFNQQIYASIAQDLEDIGDYRLYRGVPRNYQGDDAAADRPTKLHQGYRFFDEPVEIPPDLAGRFAAWALDPQHWQLHSEGKFCGGFHPDWCLMYQSEGTTVRVMICYGCHEVWIVSGDRSVKFDLPASTMTELKKISSKW